MRTTRLKTFSLQAVAVDTELCHKGMRKTSFFEQVIALWNSNLNLARATKV